MMNMKKVYMFLANGFEDVEALIPLDVLRRGGVDVKTVSITGSLVAESAHGVRVEADLMFETADVEDADLLMLPGGMPGASNLNDHEGVKEALLAQAQAGKLVSAICAAPLVLGGLGLLKGKRATCYPGFEKTLTDAKTNAETAVNQKTEDIGKLNSELTGIRGRIESTTGARAEKEKARGLKVSRLVTWLEEYNAQPEHQLKLDIAAIALLFAATDDWEEIRSRQKELAAALTSAETSLKNEKTAHEEHQQHKPEKTKEELDNRKAELENRSTTELVNLQASCKLSCSVITKPSF